MTATTCHQDDLYFEASDHDGGIVLTCSNCRWQSPELNGSGIDDAMNFAVQHVGALS